MINKILTLLVTVTLLYSCQPNTSIDGQSHDPELRQWTIEKLRQRAMDQLDSTKWDQILLKQDIETYDDYRAIFQSYPLNKSPYPVAEYDYSVSSIPFIIESDSFIFKGVRIGEYKDADSDLIQDRLTLIVLTNDKESIENTLVDSRNFPYLTAQGIFEVKNNEFDWVFSRSPDGFSTLLINMKLFDLRFGETIIIYPQSDKSFFYDQINDTPNNYQNFDDFEEAIVRNSNVQNQLTSNKNIQ